MIAEHSPVVRADIEATSACNLKCLHCMVETNRNARPLSYRQWQRVLRRLRRQGVVVVSFTGGEPLLNPDIVEIVEEAAALGFVILFFTNGTLLQCNLVEALSSLPIQWSVSLDGASAATHDRIRGEAGAFAKTMAGIRLLVEDGCDVRIESVITGINVQEISRLAELVASIGCKRYSASALRLCRRSWVNREQLWLDRSAMLAVRTALEAKQKKLAGKLAIDLPYQPMQRAIDEPASRKMFACSAGISKLGILLDGSVVPCLLLNNMILGNAQHTDLRDCTDSLVLRQLRSATEEVECGDCENREFCGKGCRAAALYTQGDLLAKDPSCYGWITP